MRSICFFFLTVFFGLHANFAQDSIPHISIHSLVPTADDSDLKHLDSYFEDVQIVGLGESTHGTHEFATLRHRIFKYLVENHDFNTFFLEADYATCLRANNYIHGADDDVEKAVDEIGLWPWITTEMADVVNWMREYNATNPDRPLRFIGVDAQDFPETLIKIDQILEKYHLPTTDTAGYRPITRSQFFQLKQKNITPYFDLLAIKEAIDTKPFTYKDREEYENLVRHFRQIIEIQNEKKPGMQSLKRDITMALNMLYHLSAKSSLKGIYWAHNGHISNVSRNEFGTEEWGGLTGGYLKEVLDDKYFSIAFEFDEGSFNAFYPDKNSKTILEKKSYTLGELTIGPSADGTYAYFFRHLNETAFIDFNNLPQDLHLFMNAIGAAYFPNKNKKTSRSKSRYDYFGIRGFDAIIIIPKTTATHLLRAKSD